MLDLVQADKGLDGQMVESVVSLATMCQFLCMMAVSCLPMSEKGVIMGECWFLYVVFIGITGNCGCGSWLFYVFNDEVQWVRAGKKNACQVAEFCLKNVVLRDDHVVSKCLGIDDTFFIAEWMVRMEVKQCHAVGWFSVQLRFKFSGFRKIDLHFQECDSCSEQVNVVFDGGADCIHECHQGIKLGVGAQENEENVINKTFPKLNQVGQSQDYGEFFLFHEQIGKGGVTLVPMEVPWIWCICVSMNHSCYALFMWNVCVQGRDISCDQEGIVWQFFIEVEKMFRVFDV